MKPAAKCYNKTVPTCAACGRLASKYRSAVVDGITLCFECHSNNVENLSALLDKIEDTRAG